MSIRDTLMEAAQNSYEEHKARIKGIKKGTSVSFKSDKTGKSVTGTYKGLKTMGGRAYAHVEHEGGGTYVPVHQVKHDGDKDGVKTLKESVELTEAEAKVEKGASVSFKDARTGKTITGKFHGWKQMGGRKFAHVEHEAGATYVPTHQLETEK
jgi:hypothetical protein